MAVAKVVGKIFGMFDKIDDIVYEPVKLVCDVLRQPLKQVEVHNEKSKAEHEQELKKQLQQFEADLEMSKKKQEMELSMEQRRLEEEINQRIIDNEVARRDEMVRLEMEYRKEMMAAAEQFQTMMVNLQHDTRSKLLALYNDNKVQYLEVQKQYKMDMFETVKELKELDDDGSNKEAINVYLMEQLKLLAQSSADFLKMLNTDFEKVVGQIDIQVTEIQGIATRYLTPALANERALTQNVVDAIETTEN